MAVALALNRCNIAGDRSTAITSRTSGANSRATKPDPAPRSTARSDSRGLAVRSSSARMRANPGELSTCACHESARRFHVERSRLRRHFARHVPHLRQTSNTTDYSFLAARSVRWTQTLRTMLRCGAMKLDEFASGQFAISIRPTRAARRAKARQLAPRGSIADLNARRCGRRQSPRRRVGARTPPSHAADSKPALPPVCRPQDAGPPIHRSRRTPVETTSPALPSGPPWGVARAVRTTRI